VVAIAVLAIAVIVLVVTRRRNGDEKE